MMLPSGLWRKVIWTTSRCAGRIQNTGGRPYTGTNSTIYAGGAGGTRCTPSLYLSTGVLLLLFLFLFLFFWSTLGHSLYYLCQRGNGNIPHHRIIVRLITNRSVGLRRGLLIKPHASCFCDIPYISRTPLLPPGRVRDNPG